MRGVFQKAGKGLSWWIRWTCPYGHRHEEKVGPKSAAQDLVERRRVAVKVEGFCLARHRAAVSAATTAPIFFRDAAMDYLAWAAHSRPRSVAFRRSALSQWNQHFGSLSVSDIRPENIEIFLRAKLEAGTAPATLNRWRAVLSHLLARLVRQGLLPENPAGKTDRRPERSENPRPLTHDEEARLLLVVPPEHKPCLLLAIHTGLRLGELRHQAWRDVDLAGASLRVTQPKSGQEEAIPLNAVASRILSALERTGPLVFPGLPPHMSRLFGRWAAQAHLDGVTFHCLRDTFISRLAPHVAAPTLMVLARHRDWRTTRRYVRVDGEHLRQAVDRLVPDQSSISVVSSDS